MSSRHDVCGRCGVYVGHRGHNLTLTVGIRTIADPVLCGGCARFAADALIEALAPLPAPRFDIGRGRG